MLADAVRKVGLEMAGLPASSLGAGKSAAGVKVDGCQCGARSRRDSRSREMESLQIICPHLDTINRVPRERLSRGGKCGACNRLLFEGRPPLPLDDSGLFSIRSSPSLVLVLHGREIARTTACHAAAATRRVE